MTAQRHTSPASGGVSPQVKQAGWGGDWPAGGPVRVERIEVQADRVAFDVRIDDARWRNTDPALARRILQMRPDLSRHACVNAVGKVFGDVVANTPMPHLIEHLTIDYLVESAGDPHAAFTGTSHWTDKASGRARIQVSLHDDAAVLAAFKRAVTTLDDALDCL